MRRWPALQTRPCASWAEGFGFWVKASMGMIALCLVLAIVLVAVATVAGWVWLNDPIASALEAFALVLFLSPIISAPVLLASAPVVAWAALKGRAGWAVAMAWGAAVSPIALWVVDDFNWDEELLIVGLPAGAIFGALFWLSAKIFQTDMMVSP